MARWAALAALVVAQVAYPLVSGGARASLVVVTVLLGYAASVGHAFATQPRVGLALVAVTTGGGFAIEALGLATGFPFGRYEYGPALGPTLLGVPLVIPLAWTWMAWPAWLSASMVARSAWGRVLLAAVALAAWDLFLDPQMVAEGYWRWTEPSPTLPGVDGVPVVNHVGWLAISLLMMLVLSTVAPVIARREEAGVGSGADVRPAGRPAATGAAPMLALYLWTYVSSVVAHTIFLGLPASAFWGGLGMGVVALPLAVRLAHAVRLACG
jgi:putative membrane protein